MKKRVLIVLDADDFREVWTELTFSEKDRRIQNDRLAKIARLLWIQGKNVVIASVCPYADQRRQIRNDILPDVKWIYVNSKDSKSSSKEYPFEEGW